MFCRYCGNEIDEAAKFCGRCGNTTGNEQITPAEGVIKPRKCNKKMIAILVSVLACVALLIAVIPGAKSPEELLLNNEWYREMTVNTTFHDYSFDVSGYYFEARCEKIKFHSDGGSSDTLYMVHYTGPYSYEVDADNIPEDVIWSYYGPDEDCSWEVLDEKTMVYDGEHYLWDGEKDVRCNCRDEDKRHCEHNKTWYITKEYLRIGNVTYTSERPENLRADD